MKQNYYDRARLYSKRYGINASLLLTPSGFSGPNGTFVLLPDGHVRRSLALFEIGAEGVRRRSIEPDQPNPADVM